MKTVRAIMAVWTLLCFTGCTSIQAIKEPTPDRIRAQVEVGDEIHVSATNGTIYDLEVTRMDDDSLTGRAESGKRYKVPYSAIESIEVRGASAARTGGALGVVTLVLYAAAVYLALVLFDVVDTASGN